MAVHDLIVGTGNLKKGRELAELLEPTGLFRIRDLRAVAADASLPDPLDVDESGDSFRENARLKAVQQALHLGQWVLADDSGIEVDALDGRPGIYSARYAGLPSDDQANNAKLLAELDGQPWERRGAQYVCVVIVADPDGIVRAEAQGVCRGRLRFAASGAQGFGYDPLFEVREYHRTFGELGGAVKRAISHRARAMRQVVPQLIGLARSGQWRTTSSTQS